MSMPWLYTSHTLAPRNAQLSSHSSQATAHPLRILSSPQDIKCSDLIAWTLWSEDLSALFVLWDASKRTTIGEDQSRSAYSSIIPPIFKQPNYFRQASIRLKKRQADEGESVTRTSNLREAAPDNQLLEAGLAPPGTESPELDSGKTQAPRGKSSPPASPKAPVPQTVSTKKAPEQPELFDAGLKGALIIGTAAILMGIYLVLRKKLTPEPESQMPVVYEKGGLDGPSAQASFGRNASISGPFGDSNAVDDSWQVKPGASRSEKVASLGTNRAQGGRLPARTPSLPGKTVAFPSRVKVTKQMTKQPPPRQGQGVQARIPVPGLEGLGITKHEQMKKTSAMSIQVIGSRHEHHQNIASKLS
ncbi:hypothetical protein PSHT_00304 [Puccinia striiformis]|uniref:Uncharacterized protein n=1 Tax=Puccinia striiformis TaxID=27350 RepID=A0A2S4WNM9_9BASI|nr:hypothetical protein PSHT_00304 [Puccinia striiformis]